MTKNTDILFSYRFVANGTVAPDLINENELWLDVGNRLAPRVLDHHGGDTDKMSALALVLTHYKEYIVNPLSKKNQIVLVVHASPDLDAICSSWAAKKILKSTDEFYSDSIFEQIETAVSENDQGLIRTENPKTNWAIVMRSLLMQHSSVDNHQKIIIGETWVETTYQLLKAGKSFDKIAGQLITPETRQNLDQAHNEYEQDILHSDIFQVSLPRHNSRSIEKADAIILYDPKSFLFKELARGDKKNSPQQLGFNLLIVVRTIVLSNNFILNRYIISTDPLSGFHLKGLGEELEKLEQLKEDEAGLPLMKGRERVGPGKGRFGLGVKSPWYDGRGHQYTIVDSPSIEFDGKAYCLSLLTVKEVKSIILKST